MRHHSCFPHPQSSILFLALFFLVVKKQQYEDYFLTARGMFLYITASGVKEGLASLLNKKI